nr:phosphatidylinositol 3,4,5-trisphosphate 3-phosphatase and protein-tyrosine-phosphatase PTEN1 [Ipomoea trifida]
MGLRLGKQGQKKPAPVAQLNYIHAQQDLVNLIFRSCYIRNLVSKKRRRLLVGGYDLDMTYITDRLLAMSFPAEHMRAMYRNPMWQVYNLCIEQAYDPTHFYGRVERYPFDDNHVPPLQMVKEFCEDVHSWLSSDPKNTAVIHCMAGKGRTGLMVCAYLVYTGMSAEEALQVSIPSQRRYVGYWEKVLSFPDSVDRGIPDVNLPKPCSRELRRIRLYDTVNVDSIFFVVSQLQNVMGDVRIIFYEKLIGGRLFYACFNTSFIKSGLLQLSLREMDKVGKKGKSICGPAFCVELIFGPANPSTLITPQLSHVDHFVEEG